MSAKRTAKILIIDDEPGIRDLLTYELGLQGYSVDTASDGTEGLEKIRNTKFNLVVSDLKMPKMNGIQVLEAAKKLNPNIEVIMATGFGTIEEAVLSIKLGAYDFIQKPFNINELTNLIEKALEKAELEKKIDALQQAYKDLAEMKDELVQSEKLAAIGQLASGVAHELNNPLTTILGLAGILIEAETSEEKKTDLKILKEQTIRCQKIIMNVLQFARKQKFEIKILSINDAINKSLELAAYQLKNKSIQIIKNLDNSIPPIQGDEHRIQQVFLNLITNAEDAMDSQPHPKLHIQSTQDKDKVKIYFIDNGCGIPQKSLSKIFNPFFTTKDVGKGTGLGLSVSFGIIKDHGGTISVRSQEGKGSTFCIDLPIPSK